MDAGLLPAAASPSCPDDLTPSASWNCLPMLQSYWSNAAGTAPRSVRRLLSDCAATGGLFAGAPVVPTQLAAEWLGARLAWCPGSVPPGPRFALISSRLGRRLEQQRQWFTALRVVCRQLAQSEFQWLVADDTAVALFAARAAAMFQIPHFRVRLCERASLRRWASGLRPAEQADGFPPAWLFSPAASPAASRTAPSRDVAQVVLADEVLALHIRRGGHQHELLRRVLMNPPSPTPVLRINACQDLVPQDVFDELTQLGARAWHAEETVQTSPPERRCGGQVARILPVPPMPNYLVHCTRRCDGAWPGQSANDFLNELITGGPVDKTTPAVLRRILTERRLRPLCCR